MINTLHTKSTRKQSQCKCTTVKDLPGQLLEQVLAHVSFRERCGVRLDLILAHMYQKARADMCALSLLTPCRSSLQGQGCSCMPHLAPALVTTEPAFVAGKPGRVVRQHVGAQLVQSVEASTQLAE